MTAEARRAPLPTSVWTIDLVDEPATLSLAADVAALVRPGDLITLSGDLGAGKTTFARALIRILTNEPELEVPSPTFTLIQVYESAVADAPHYPIVHADLFRIKEASELAELGWDEAADGALVLVEWPERAGDGLAVDRLEIAFRTDGDKGASFRTAAVTGVGAFAGRLAHQRALNDILARGGFAGATRQFMMGDASSRAYERLTRGDGTTAILMIAPPRPDGPPVRFGKSYSALAHLAEDIRPFVAMAAGLRDAGFSAPAVLAHDVASGLAIIEDLGAEPVVDGEGPVFTRYAEAVAGLAALHGSQRPASLPDGSGWYLRDSALRYRGADDRDRAASRLVRAAHRAGDAGLRRPLRLQRSLARSLRRHRPSPTHLDPARLPFAEPDLAAGPRRRRPGRADRFPGLRARPSRL